jgi:hypothetical protein
MSYERIHWQTLNVLMRITGIWFSLGGIVFLWSAVSIWLGLRSSTSGEDIRSELIAALIAMALGGYCLIRRGIRADQGDMDRMWLFFLGRSAGAESIHSRYAENQLRRNTRRSWWTGEFLEKKP